MGNGDFMDEESEEFMDKERLGRTEVRFLAHCVEMIIRREKNHQFCAREWAWMKRGK